ncbi:MAG: DUF2076 domain-containing protein [Thiohalocapsa sp.]
MITTEETNLNQQERAMIDGLFDRLRQAEQQQGGRDEEAEALIEQRMASQPAASYLLAQVVLMQEQGLHNLQGRVEQLEKDLAASRQPVASDGGFLGGLFGGSSQQKTPAAGAPQIKRSGWSNSASPAAARAGMAPGSTGQAAAGAQGGGFLAGAMQTAMGVAGGVLLANAVSGLFADDSEAADASATAPEDLAEPPADAPMEEPADDEGGFFGGDFFGGDDEF